MLRDEIDKKIQLRKELKKKQLKEWGPNLI